ncbi:DUF2225 domain-containing protein [Pelosinus sp. sgz500959]|uniref:DUF2225 domain-containing protein n=1 Tax=Pelosinus sp. sgz500959 TaxID=3242472 RepID=UPI003672130F
MADALYFVEKQCAVCEEKFEVTFVRSRLSLIKQDTDFCAYYKDINPYYYTVWVCPHCGYAAQENEFTNLAPVMATRMKAFLYGRDVKVNLCGIRTREQAIVSYQLAIFYTEMLGFPASKIAALQLRLAWLYRESGQVDEEKKVLAKACASYDLALSKERMPIGNLSELTVMYLVADLLWRTGDGDKAKLYLSRIVSSPLAKIEKRIADLARDLWQEIRAIEKTTPDQSEDEK